MQTGKQKAKAGVTKTSAMAKVSTARGGDASIKLHAQVPLSQASSSVTVNVSSGSAFTKAKAQEPSGRRKTTKPAKFSEYLMLPPAGTK